MPGRWLVDYRKKSAIYQPLTHYSTMRYTPAGRYGRFFALIKFCKHTLLETRHNYLCTSAKSVGEKFCNKFCEFCEFRGRTYAPNESVSIRAICGRIFPSRRFCEFCVFRGRTYAPSRIRAIRVIRVRFITGIYVCLLHCFIGQ